MCLICTTFTLNNKFLIQNRLDAFVIGSPVQKAEWENPPSIRICAETKIPVYKMKKAFPLIVLLASLWACTPKVDEVSVEDLDITASTYELGTDFTQYKTYSMPDSVLLVGNDDDGNLDTTFSNNDIYRTILDQVETEMTKLGYNRVSRDTGDVGILVSTITANYTGAGFVPGWCSGWGSGWWTRRSSTTTITDAACLLQQTERKR